MKLGTALLLGLTALPAFGWDVNNDGVSDVFAALHGLAPGTANNDNDGDGATNLQEALAGTNPNSAASRFTAASENAPAGAVKVTWAGITGKRYQPQVTADLATWTDLGAPQIGAGATLEFTDAAPLPAKKFYRIRVLASLDQDGDGFDDWEEALLGTSPTVRDGDADKVSDAWEVFYFGNTTAITGASDTDGDLIEARDEYTWKLDPLVNNAAIVGQRANFSYTANDELAVYTPVVGASSTYAPDAEGNLKKTP